MDSFVRDNLPPVADLPELLFSLPELQYPQKLNCISRLLDRWADGAEADRPAIHAGEQTLSYRELYALVNRVASALVDDLGVKPQQRILLRAANTPMLAACWLATVKVGAVAVTTMPLLRSRELTAIIDRAQVGLALCDERLESELSAAVSRAAAPPRVVMFGSSKPDALDALAAERPSTFASAATSIDDPVLIAFTSGTTGRPKGAVHTHRDVLAVCDTFSRHIVGPTADDVFCGTPPLAFTFGLGGLLLFPLHVGASTVLLEKATPEGLLDAVTSKRATAMFTSPTMYRSLIGHLEGRDVQSLRACVSAGETLPAATYDAWQRATGGRLIDGIGATELLHIFISAAGDDIRRGATGKVVPGYEARVVDDALEPVPHGTVGRLAVRGPTGCRYLGDPERQRDYVRGGWNLTGDAYVEDAEGYFWYQARVDDLIVSSGYKIAGPEIENVLLEHSAVRECAVVGMPDEARGSIVAAFVVPADGFEPGRALAEELQQFAKRELAPYKYPRRIEFVTTLPRTETGKLQRFKLRTVPPPPL